MSEFKNVINALASKLQQDRVHRKVTSGSEDLEYLMNVRLQQNIIDELVAEGLATYPIASKVASKVAKRYLDGLIDLAIIVDNE
jgi:hypothetical protein